MKTKWMKALAGGCAAVLMLPSMLASARTDDAVVFADFEGTGTPAVGQKLPGNEPGKEVWLNGTEDATVTLTGTELKVEMGATGYLGLGNGFVRMRQDDGAVTYKYLVLRIKGETGGENRKETGGIMISIGGAEGSHVRALNDRDVGTAPPALGKDNNPMPAITTEYQNFVIALNDQNIRKAEASRCISININNVMNPITLYIDDIYFTNTYPSDAAEYVPDEPDEPAGPSDTPDPGNTTTTPPSTDPTTSDVESDPSVPADASSNPASGNNESKVPTTSGAPKTTVPDSSASANNNGGGLSMGAIIGIVAAVVVVLGGGGAALYFFVIRKKIG